ncbi:M20 family metallopeptidase [Amphibacillus sediminis]|uniref:M20 family metallopeptidase n=1 Tax=Amphibacillus sediminis TaxID=360185 RepID=UPI000834A99C|nr:M20 family metallopeptidase [Amphibacillus sediminis]
MKQQLKQEINNIETDLRKISRHLYDNPELGGEEYQSAKLLTDYLQSHKFKVETGIVDRPTAFRAVYDSGKPGATIGYMAEYDALPGVGHGCGHNLISTMGIGAGILLSKVLDQIGGKVIVYGTPAEETNGAKVPMAEAGLFNELDVAMMVHPAGESSMSGDSLAMDAIEFSYRGKTSHAAAVPEEGINALDSVIQLFNGINALRQHVKSDVRIHGIITEGGVAANVVPDYAVAQFYIRAKQRSYLNKVVDQVKRIAAGAAEMTGATLSIRNYELSYDDMKTNQTLSQAFKRNLVELGEKQIHPAKRSLGSIDMGNVSQVVPAIHPYIGLDHPGLVAHTVEFAKQTITEAGQQAMLRGALALAMTGYDLIMNQDLLEQIKKEFQVN